MSKSSDENKITCYGKHRVFRMFMAEVKINMRSESYNMNLILEAHYGRYTPANQQNLLDEFNRLEKIKKK